MRVILYYLGSIIYVLSLDNTKTTKLSINQKKYFISKDFILSQQRAGISLVHINIEELPVEDVLIPRDWNNCYSVVEEPALYLNQQLCQS
jgi:hypothetical protein